MAANPALEAALALARNPALAAPMRSRPLPAGVALLLRLAAGDDGAEDEAARLAGTPLAGAHLAGAHLAGAHGAMLREAVEAYLQKVLLHPGADPHRILGVAPGASRAEQRAHLKWLMAWLHPDQTGADWRSAFAARVLAAWRELAAAPPGSTLVPARVQPAPHAEPHHSPQHSPHAATPASPRGARRRSGPAAKRVRVAWVSEPLAAPARPRSLRKAGLWLAGATLLTAGALVAVLALRGDLAEAVIEWAAADALRGPQP